jgi:hypothetical protein
MADEVIDTSNTEVPEVVETTKVENIEGDEERKVEKTEEEKQIEKTEQEQKEKKQSRLDRRFKELTSKVKTAESQVASWAETLRELTGEAPPVRTEFATQEDYQDAVSDYREKIRGPKTMLEQSQREHVKAETELTNTLIEAWDAKIEAVKAEHPDYEEVVSAAKVPMLPMTQKAILRSPLGANIAYYLATNQDEALDLYELSPEEQILEIGRLESKVQTGRKVVPATRVQQKEPNPPPGSSVKAEQASRKKDPANMSLDEFAAWRKAGGGR